VRSKEDIRKIAIHEAAHAVIGELLGCPVESVTIVADEDAGNLGNAVHFHGDPYSDPGGYDWNLAVRAITNYAGHMATVRLGYDDDFETAGADNDYSAATDAISGISGGNSEKADVLQEQLLDTTRLMVEMAWDSIEIIADYLEKSQTIDGTDIPKLLAVSDDPFVEFRE
jgi:hypothetical protein